MTEIEQLAVEADVPRALAEMVAVAAERIGLSLRSFRTYDRRPHLVAARQRLIVLARDRGFSSPQIGRALNRDHSTVLLAERRARTLGRAGLLSLQPEPRPAPEFQLEFLHGPLFDFIGAAA